MAGLDGGESSTADEHGQPGEERDVAKSGDRERPPRERGEAQQSQEAQET
jgi:hypothetical protein